MHEVSGARRTFLDPRAPPASALVKLLFRHLMVVGPPRRDRQEGLRLPEEVGGDSRHGCLMRFDAVPRLDDRQAGRIVVLQQELARPTARGVNDAGNDRPEKFAERPGLSRLGLELVDPGYRHNWGARPAPVFPVQVAISRPTACAPSPPPWVCPLPPSSPRHPPSSPDVK